MWQTHSQVNYVLRTIVSTEYVYANKETRRLAESSISGFKALMVALHNG